MTTSNLSIWLAENGFQKDTIGYFALLSLPFSFKILWSPIIDHVKIPFFTKSPRKGWLFVALVGMALSIFGLSFVDPCHNIELLVSCLILLSLFSGCLYIVGIAYELESLEEHRYSVGSASVISGYRTGLLCAGGGALYLAHLFGWPSMFMALSALLICGALLVLIHPEPYKSHIVLKTKKAQYSHYPSHLVAFWQETILQPCKAFFSRSDVGMLLTFLVLFKAPDQLFKSMEGPFYIEMGFDKQDLAFASKTCGFAATIAGAFITGLFLRNKDPLRSAAAAGIIHAATLIGYWLQASIEKSYALLYLTSIASDFTGGMAMTSFIFLLWRICDKKFAPVQYVFLWSLFSLKADLLACLGGILATKYSWDYFFFLIILIGLFASVVSWKIVPKKESCIQQV